MRKICLVAVILVGIVPSLLCAENVEIKKTASGDSQETVAAESNLKSVKDSSSARKAARSKDGSVHAEKNLSASKNKSSKTSSKQKPPEVKPVPPGRKLVQTVRPQSKLDTKPGQSKTASKETAQPRNVLVT